MIVFLTPCVLARHERTACLQIPTGEGECLEGFWPPLDFPACGFLGESCIEKEKDSVGLVISVVLAVILICVIVIGFFVFRKYKEEAEIARMNWKIDPSEIMTSRTERGRCWILHFDLISNIYRSNY